MKQIAIAITSACTAIAFAQSCPEIATEATKSYSATFSGADISVLRDHWQSINAALAKCESTRGKPVSLKEELGDFFYIKLKSPDQVLEEKEQKKRDRKLQLTSGQGLLVNNAIFQQLTDEDQDSLLKKYPLMQVVNEDSVGKVVSHQIINNSDAGNNTGSKLGAAYGQATYIDNAIANRSYSAAGQLSAGLLGATLGSGLNREAKKRFTVNYGIQMTDGSIRTISHTSSSESANPVGQCIWTGKMLEAPMYLCNDSLVGFLGRVKRVAVNSGRSSPSDSVNRERIRCKVDALGEVSVQPEECRELKGIVVTWKTE